MRDGSWVFVVIAALLIFGLGGYVLGRRNAEQRDEIGRLKGELAEARQQIEQMSAGVSNHFEQSAALFSQLSKDYRQFLDHFHDSATALGLSEARAEELIDQIARPLLAHTGTAQALQDAADAPPAEVGAADADNAPPVDGSTMSQEPEGGAPPRAAEEDAATVASPQVDGGTASGEPTGVARREDTGDGEVPAEDDKAGEPGDVAQMTPAGDCAESSRPA